MSECALKDALWIKPAFDFNDRCPEYEKTFACGGKVKKATIHITATGTYEATLNGKRVGDFIMAPGWTAYQERVQYQTYDITDLLLENNKLSVDVGKGWFRSQLSFAEINLYAEVSAIIAKIEITYEDGKKEVIITDDSWVVAPGRVIYSELYHGEMYDGRGRQGRQAKAVIASDLKYNLVPQIGPFVTEHERLKAKELIITPRGERVIDFGQEITGYVEFKINAKKNERVTISHAEVLDKNGNFYTANLRTARQRLEYLCRDGEQTYKPKLTFMGFRYIRLDDYPAEIDLDNFTAIAVYSDMERRGTFECGDNLVNKLYENIIWGHRGNYLDVPTDCPQRDERLGWTADTQVFTKTGAYNYDVEAFFKKWLGDVAADQDDEGCVPHVVPNVFVRGGGMKGSSAWGDAAVICPWIIYLMYGNKEILKDQIESMKGWISFIRKSGDNEFLWNTGSHHGDWLAMDAPPGSYLGASRKDFINTAFYAYSTSLVAKSLKVLGEDATEYEELHKNIVKAFRNEFPDYKTQTEHVLALNFDLAEDKKATAESLAKMIKDNGNKLTTGFVGTPYIMYALSDNGQADVAYSLLLQKEAPSWLYSVLRGATTVWEHWDSMNEEGEFWSVDMNSFNHYAYGAVASWMYEVAGGIVASEENPGFSKVIVKPVPDERLGYVKATHKIKEGVISSYWKYEKDGITYEIKVPKEASIIIEDKTFEVGAGEYKFFKSKTGEIKALN